MATAQILTVTYSGQAVLGLELLGILDGIVYKGEASGLASTIGGSETEHGDGGSILHLVHLQKNRYGHNKAKRM